MFWHSTLVIRFGPGQNLHGIDAVASEIVTAGGRAAALPTDVSDEAADGASTGGSYCVFEVETPLGPGDATQIHDFADRACYLLEGELEVFVDDEVHSLRQGSFIFIPRGSVSASRVTSKRARYLVIHTEPGFERMIRACGAPVAEPGPPPAGWRQEDIPPERLREIRSDIGLRPILVPGAFNF